MSDSREAMRAAVEALETARAGLEWYRDYTPDNVDESDAEADEQIDAALSLLRAALEARGERCTYPECSCEQPEHGGCGHPHAYTEAIGEAGEDYHRQFMNAHPLPAQWRWSELWGRMLAASPVAATQGDGPQAARDVLAERKRQVSAEGWTPEHDDEHTSGCMAAGAACYALLAASQAGNNDYWNSRFREQAHQLWQWDREWFKPKDARSNLVRAAALALAEIERIDRAAIGAESEQATEDGRNG